MMLISDEDFDSKFLTLDKRVQLLVERGLERYGKPVRMKL